MFASLLAYQIIDITLALAATLLCMRFFPRGLEQWLVTRFPALLATPFRRLVLLHLPAFGLLMGALLVAGSLFLFPLFNDMTRGLPQLQRSINVGSFLIVGVAWYGLFVLFPLFGLAHAWREAAGSPLAADRRAFDRRAACVLAVASALLLFDTMVHEPAGLVVEDVAVELADWPADRPPLRVVLISDVQSARLGARERRLPDLVASLRPDLILVAGDTVAQSFDPALPLEQARWLAQRLHAPLGVFAVNGDVDDVIEGGIARILEGTPVHLLANESLLLPTDPPIELLGCDPRDEAGEARLLATPAKAALRVGLVHRPRHHVELAAAGCDLVLAGHTHGGQIVIPGFGPPMTLEIVARAVAAGGLHRMTASEQLYVTRGVGVEGGFAPPIRFNCPPEITLLRLGPVHGGAGPATAGAAIR